MIHKKRKIEFSSCWNADILYEICTFLLNLKDFIHLAETCKNFYDWIINNEITLNLIFKNYNFTKNLPTIIPNYLLNIKYLHFNKDVVINEKQLQLFTKIEKLYLPEEFTITNSTFITFKNLKHLYIKRSNVKNINFNILQNLESFGVLTTDICDEQLQSLQNLNYLYINKCFKINGKCLKNLTNLNTLIINRSLINDENLSFCKNLISLKIFDCKLFEGFGLLNLKNLIYLEINIFNCKIKDKHFQNLKKLKYLDINFCNHLTDAIFINLQNLKKLKIKDCEEIYGNNFKFLKKLIYLNIYNGNVKEENIKELIFLRELNIRGCNNFTGNCLQYLKYLQKFSFATSLDLLSKEYKDKKSLQELIQQINH